jgi:orotidine-5'-phosphate decarboxylase
VTASGAGVGAYLERLGARIARTGTALCLGIDPDPGALPVGYPRDLVGVERLAALLIDVAVRHAAAVKVNLAFFEAWGGDGLHALERLRARVPADVPFIADAKRGDIGSTSAQHAAALYDRLDAHAITASPYLGSEAIRPLLDRPDRFVYLLCRTSNPGAGELQELEVSPDTTSGAPAEPLALRVARLAGDWERHPGTVGLVVGATAPAELGRIREVAPSLPFLVPGVGSQGGDAAAALRDGPALSGPAGATVGGALLVNVSRGIASTAIDATDPGVALDGAAATWARTLQVLR